VSFRRRKEKAEAADTIRCPVCHERLPDAATVCHMCGEPVASHLRARLEERAGHRTRLRD